MGMTEKAGAWSSHSRLLYLELQAQEGLSAPAGSQKEWVLPSAWGPWREGGSLHLVWKKGALPQYLQGDFWAACGFRALGNPLCDPLARLR